MRKLGISKEFQRARLVTNDREVLKLREEIAVCRNNREPDKARMLLKLMKERVSMDIPENKQYFLEAEASLDWMEGMITRKEFIVREEEALRCTLKVKRLYNLDEVYLTQMEMFCIRKKVQVSEDLDKMKGIDFLLQFFDWFAKRNALPDCIVIYEFVVVSVINELGNIGEYRISIDLSKKLLKESLICRRMWIIADSLYNILWNENQCEQDAGRLCEKEKMTEKLQQCIMLSHFCKQNTDKSFYQSKIFEN